MSCLGMVPRRHAGGGTPRLHAHDGPPRQGNRENNRRTFPPIWSRGGGGAQRLYTWLLPCLSPSTFFSDMDELVATAEVNTYCVCYTRPAWHASVLEGGGFGKRRCRETRNAYDCYRSSLPGPPGLLFPRQPWTLVKRPAS